MDLQRWLIHVHSLIPYFRRTSQRKRPSSNLKESQVRTCLRLLGSKRPADQRAKVRTPALQRSVAKDPRDRHEASGRVGARGPVPKEPSGTLHEKAVANGSRSEDLSGQMGDRASLRRFWGGNWDKDRILLLNTGLS